MGLNKIDLNYRNYTNLVLEGNLLKGEEILEFCRKNGSAHYLAVQDFVKEWLHPSPYISIMTSGSTGKAKTIEVAKNHMLWSAAQTAKFFNFQKGQTALLCLPLTYIAGKMMVVRAFFSQLNLLVRAPKSQVAPYLSKDIRIDFAPFTPMQMDKIPENSPLPKNILLGGGPVSIALENKLQHYKEAIYHGYGMAETLSHIALRSVNGPKRSALYQAFSSVKLRLDARNCLCIQVPFQKEEIITNDIVEMQNSHSFKWMGRADNVINTGGIKVFPEDMERKIANIIPFRFFISSKKDTVLGEKVILILEKEAISAEEWQVLKTQLQSVLSKYEMPKEVFTVKTFAETHSGKIQRGETLKKIKIEI